MTEKMSKTMLDGVQFAAGSVMAPVVKSQAGKAFLAMVPGEVLLASLDAVSEYHYQQYQVKIEVHVLGKINGVWP